MPQTSDDSLFVASGLGERERATRNTDLDPLDDSDVIDRYDVIHRLITAAARGATHMEAT